MNDPSMSPSSPFPVVGEKRGPAERAPAPASHEHSFAADVGERLRVLIVAGVAAGVLIVGVGSRVAMFVLRLTSPDGVRGVESDDGFIIGRFTFGGTYNLLMLGAGVGIIAAGTYRAVSPWLIGRAWFRRFTIAAAAGVVGGSMLVHADGIDFRLLKPLWLAIAMFVALPALLAVATGAAVDRVAADDSWTRHGRWKWVLPVVMIAAFPFSAFIVAFALGVLIVWVGLQRVAASRRLIGPQRWGGSAGGVPAPVGLAVRAGWVGAAFLGMLALIEDVNALI